MEKIPLYHGTDARILAMSDEERAEFKKICQVATKFLWGMFEQYFIMFEGNYVMQYDKLDNELKPLFGDETVYNKLFDTLTRVSAQMNNNGQYQYDHLYLTTRKETAIKYAYRAFAFGEIGLNAYRMLEAAEIIGFSCQNPAITDALTKLQRFAKAEAEPVVIEITDYDAECLRMEDGRSFPLNLLPAFQNVRYLGNLSLSNAKRIDINKD